MFFTKNFKQEKNIGHLLKEARYKTGLSLKMISKHTNINPQYLEAMEKNDWQKLPGEIYTKNFLKTYSNFLKIKLPDLKKINLSSTSDILNQNNKIFIKKTNFFQLINLPKIIKFIAIVFCLIILFIYIIWQINQITRPPYINIIYPQEDLITNSNSLSVEGQTNSEVKIKINQEGVILSADNFFKQSINLLPGVNTIIIEGKTKYSKTNIIERKIIYEPVQ